MNANAFIGNKVKKLRTKKNLTLKQLGTKSGLSVGFLSQFERGLSSIALDSLEKIAAILEVPMGDLFDDHAVGSNDDPVIHGPELRFDEISPQIYQSLLQKKDDGLAMLPRLFTLLPFPDEDAVELYSHEGEEFVYVLEGIVTFFLENDQYLLYPGDCIHIRSRQRHNWMNRTSRIARILTVNTPNPLLLNKKEQNL